MVNVGKRKGKSLLERFTAFRLPMLALYICRLYTSAMADSVRAKVFWSGGSQAIRVPKALRLPSLEVKMQRRGKSLLISPVRDKEDWSGFWDRLVSLKQPVKRWKTRLAEKRKTL